MFWTILRLVADLDSIMLLTLATAGRQWLQRPSNQRRLRKRRGLRPHHSLSYRSYRSQSGCNSWGCMAISRRLGCGRWVESLRNGSVEGPRIPRQKHTHTHTHTHTFFTGVFWWILRDILSVTSPEKNIDFWFSARNGDLSYRRHRHSLRRQNF